MKNFILEETIFSFWWSWRTRYSGDHRSEEAWWEAREIGWRI